MELLYSQALGRDSQLCRDGLAHPRNTLSDLIERSALDHLMTYLTKYPRKFVILYDSGTERVSARMDGMRNDAVGTGEIMG
jgi:hypothetical protein